MPYTYPAGDHEKLAALFRLLGGFWTQVWANEDEIAAYLEGIALAERQTVRDREEVQQCVSRHTTPPHHVENWQPITLQWSERLLVAGAGEQFGGTGIFGFDPAPDHFGLDRPKLAWVVDPSWKVPVLVDTITTPTVVLVEGIDYTVADGLLIFEANPFEVITPETEFVDNGAVDYSLTLWGFQVASDRQYLWEHVGYPLHTRGPATETFRDFLNAVWDGVVGGSSLSVLQQLLTPLTGASAAVGAETVLFVGQSPNDPVVVTTRQVYKLPTGSTPAVAVGDDLEAGQALIEEFEIIPLNTGVLPASIQSIVLGEEFCQYGPLTLVNQDVDLVVNPDHDSEYTYVSFDCGANTEQFFDAVHAAGVLADETLAHLLDHRPTPLGEPTADHLPTTINPAQWVVANLLRGNATLVRTPPSGGELITDHGWLRELLPPQTAIIVQWTAPTHTDSVLAPITETVSFKGAPVAVTSIAVPTATATAKYLRGPCQCQD